MKIRIKYKHPSGRIGEFTHPLPTTRVDPSDSSAIDSFVSDFVHGINASNEPLEWHFLSTTPPHKTSPSHKPHEQTPHNVDPSVGQPKALLVRHNNKIYWTTPTDYANLQGEKSILSRRSYGAPAITSHKTRIPSTIQTERYQKRLYKKYERDKSKRRLLHPSSGEYLIVETPSPDTSTSVYKYMHKHHIPHSKTSKECTWYQQGTRQEFRLDEADPSDVADAKFYLSGFEPHILTFDTTLR